MLSWLFRAQQTIEQTRFDSSPELIKLLPYLNRLKIKKDELEAAGKEKGITSLDHQKFIIIDRIYNDIQNTIAYFNKSNRKDDPQLENKESTLLLKQILQCVLRIRSNRGELRILSTFRDGRLGAVNASVHLGIVGGSVCLAIATGSASVVLTLIGSYFASGVIRSQLGTSSSVPYSLVIIMNLLQQLHDSIIYLSKNVQVNADTPVNSLTHYDVLGVRSDATRGEITKAYRALALVLHPDKPKGDEEKFKVLSGAYATLNDPEARANYDRMLRVGASHTPFQYSENDKVYQRP